MIVPFVILSEIYIIMAEKINERQDNNTSKEIFDSQALKGCIYTVWNKDENGLSTDVPMLQNSIKHLK